MKQLLIVPLILFGCTTTNHFVKSNHLETAEVQIKSIKAIRRNDFIHLDVTYVPTNAVMYEIGNVALNAEDNSPLAELLRPENVSHSVSLPKGSSHDFSYVFKLPMKLQFVWNESENYGKSQITFVDEGFGFEKAVRVDLVDLKYVKP